MQEFKSCQLSKCFYPLLSLPFYLKFSVCKISSVIIVSFSQVFHFVCFLMRLFGNMTQFCHNWICTALWFFYTHTHTHTPMPSNGQHTFIIKPSLSLWFQTSVFLFQNFFHYNYVPPSSGLYFIIFRCLDSFIPLTLQTDIVLSRS